MGGLAATIITTLAGFGVRLMPQLTLSLTLTTSEDERRGEGRITYPFVTPQPRSWCGFVGGGATVGPPLSTDQRALARA